MEADIEALLGKLWLPVLFRGHGFGCLGAGGEEQASAEMNVMSTGMNGVHIDEKGFHGAHFGYWDRLIILWVCCVDEPLSIPIHQWVCGYGMGSRKCLAAGRVRHWLRC